MRVVDIPWVGCTNKTVLLEEAVEDLTDLLNNEELDSASYNCCDRYCISIHKYGRHKQCTRRGDVVTGRTRMGYRCVWQLDAHSRLMLPR